MSKEEFLKIQTCVLKVNIHCDGCKQKVKKILQKIDGVYTTKIDSEQGKVTVSGNVDPATLIKKLTKNGKHAEIWGAPKPPHNHLNNHFKNLQIDHNNKPGNNNKQPPHHKGGGGGGQKGGGGGHVGLAHNPQLQQQLQQLQQIKGLQDLKLPPQFMKDMKIPQMGGNPNPNPNPNQKKVELMEDDGMSDDEYDDDDYDDDLEDDEYDDDLDDLEDDLDDSPLNNKMKPPMIGNGSSQMPNMLMNNMMMKGQGGVNGGGMVTKGNVPVQINLGGGGGGGGGGDKGGKKGGGGGNVNGNQNQGGGKGGKNGGGQPQDIKIGGGSGGQNKNGGGGGGGGGISNFMANGAKKGGGMNDGSQSMPNMMSMNANGNVGHMGNMPMAHMGNTNLPMGNNLAAVQGLPAMNGAGAGGAGYFPNSGPDQVAGNPFYQQQMAAMMMNQQRANGNERFQPMMYARPPPAVNYMPPPYPPYPYPPPPGERADQYAMFSDENTASCTVM